MKKKFTLFLLILTHYTEATQLHTIKSGNWEADSVWFNNLHPDTTGDTISIYHHIMLHSNIFLSMNDYLFIDSSGWLCGNDSLIMLNGSYLFNQGFLGMYYIEMYNAKGLNLAPGYIDIGNAGMHLHGLYFHFLDSLGCIVVHTGPQECLYPCVNDTTLNISLNFNAAVFETNYQSGVYYEYNFGDGNFLNTSEHHVNHTYSNASEFWVQLIIHSCCGIDTVQKLLQIILAPPPCVDSHLFFIHPNPTDEGFWIEKEFCDNENVTVKIYTIAGQLAAKYSFITTLKMVKEYIPCKLFASACYIVAMQTSMGEYRQRLVVAHL